MRWARRSEENQTSRRLPNTVGRIMALVLWVSIFSTVVAMGWGRACLAAGLETAPSDCTSSSYLNRVYGAGPCAAPGYGMLVPGCCQCQPNCCTHVWDGYCEEQASRSCWEGLCLPCLFPKWHLFSPAGETTCGGCTAEESCGSVVPEPETPRPASTPQVPKAPSPSP